MREHTPKGFMSTAVMLAATLLHSPLTPAIIVVSDACSLEDAIVSANQDVAQGGCVAGAGADVLELTADVVLTAELPSVTEGLFLEGNGFEIRRDSAAGEFRILDLQVEGDVVLRGVALSGGSTEEPGGGIYNNARRLTLDRTRVEGSSASTGGGISSGPDATMLVLRESTIADNTAMSGVGGLGSASVTVLSGTTISGNRSEGSFLGDGGGGLRVSGYSRLTLFNSTVSSNSARTGGGGGILVSGSYGAASTLVGSTILGNESASGADGIKNYYAWLKPLTRIFNSIIAGNGDVNCANQIRNLGGTFDDDGTCDVANLIVVGVDVDEELADNGGPTETHLLLPASVAAGAGSACGFETDQRGVPRGKECDSGSVELEAAKEKGQLR